MAVAGPIKWHGGKAYFAKKFVEYDPPHIHYVEGYFGGGARLLQKDPTDVSEVVNDLNGELTNFWRVLQSETLFEQFRRIVEAVPFSEVEFKIAARPIDSDETEVERAVRFFIRCRQSLAGRMKGFTGVTKTRVRRRMNNEVSAWLTAVEGLPAVHERLKRVLILNRPALDVIRGQDGPDTFFYLDPPYVHETRKTTGEYAYEMSNLDHEDLLKLLATIKGKFMLSGYRSSLYDNYAAAYTWRRVDFKTPNHASGANTKEEKTECIWMNY